jgi:hypothetical protein
LGVFYAAMIVTGAVMASRLSAPRQGTAPKSTGLPRVLVPRRMFAPTTATIH